MTGYLPGFVTSTTPERWATSPRRPSVQLRYGQHISDRHRYFCSPWRNRPESAVFIGRGPPSASSTTRSRRTAAKWCHLPAAEQARHQLKDYYSNLPTLGVLPPMWSDPCSVRAVTPIDQFYVDAAAGEPARIQPGGANTTSRSEENPQDIQFGDQFGEQSGQRRDVEPRIGPKTMLIWTYDEHGGYYDHVPHGRQPPDDVPPALVAGRPSRKVRPIRIRVPCAVVSPFSKKNYVSHTIYDQTSILKTVEEKLNLSALTDVMPMPNSLFDMLDLHGSRRS